MTTQVVRYVAAGRVGVGVRDSAEPTTVRPLDTPSLAALLALPSSRLRDVVESAAADPVHELRLLPPIDGLTEVWASGVTYRRSSEARQEESKVADMYARVYDAQRPELFLKSTAWRVCGDGEPIGIRIDSEINVPEPELAVVCNGFGEIVGLTVCNDMSSRSIEGENPLYLPQAKIYSGACAVGPGIVPVWAAPDPSALAISLTVSREGGGVWSASTSTSMMRRQFDDLVEHLFRQAAFPDGVILSTGTGVVPDLDFTLRDGDLVVIDIEGVGRLANQVRPATAELFAWLTPAPDRTPA